MKLYEPYPDTVSYRENTYRLHVTVASVLAALDALEDECLSEYYQLSAALNLLIEGPHPEEADLLDAVFLTIFPQDPPVEKEPVLDFVQDADLIYAAFVQAYGIDLHKEARTMHWCKFVQLLKGIPASTRLAERMRLRAMPVPAPTAENARQRAELIAAKAEVRIRKSERNRTRELYKLYQTMVGLAEGR